MGLIESIVGQFIVTEAVDALESKPRKRSMVKKKRRKSSKKRTPPRTATGRFRKRRKARR